MRRLNDERNKQTALEQGKHSGLRRNNTGGGHGVQGGRRTLLPPTRLPPTGKLPTSKLPTCKLPTGKPPTSKPPVGLPPTGTTG